jgi:hypothetical protein
MANNGVGRIGIRSYVAVPTQITASTLLTSLYSVWNADTTSSTLDTSIFGAWNGEAYNNATVKNAWNANGNAIDSKSAANGTIVTPNSTNGYTTSSMTYGTGKLGTASFTFDGTNFVTLPNNTFKFINDFTVSCWFYVPTNYVNNAYLLSAFDNQASYPTYFGWMMGYDSTNKNISFYICRNDMGQYYTLGLSTATNSIVPGQWNHVTVTRKLSTRSRIYINGVLSTSNTSTINPVYNNGYSSIGSAYYAFSYPFWKAANAGLKIDAVQTWESELDQTAVTELYNSGNGQEYPFTVSNSLIPSFNDAVGTNNGTRPDTTLNGGVLGPVFTTGKVGNAFQFDGINDFIQLPNNSMNFTGDFSISAWLYFPTSTQLTGSDYSFILANWTAVTWSSNLAGWRLGTSGNSIDFIAYNGSTTTTLSLGTGAGVPALDRNGWRHIVFTRTGTEYKLWLDGGQYTSTSTTMTTPKYAGTIIPKIGRAGDSTMGGWDAYGSSKILIDAVTVWQKSLSSDEITQLYNAGNGTQYPFSSQTLPSSANQLGVDNGTLMNGCSLTTGKIGKAFTFDGVNDYVSLPDNSLNFTGDFTTSFWFYANAFTGQDSFVTCENWSSPNDNGWYIYHYQGNLAFSVYNGINSTGWKTSTTITTGTWYHVVVVKNRSTSPKFYIDGNLVGTVLRNGSDITLNPGYVTTQYCSLGTDRYAVSTAQAYLNGKMDSVNVWQREITQSEVTELYNSGNGKQLTTTPIVTSGLVLNLDASRKSSYPNTGTTWTDISGSGNNGTLTNGPIFGTANGGQINFDGVNDYIDLGTKTALAPGTTNFTISFWINPNNWGSLSSTSYSPIFVTLVNGGLWIGKNGANFVLRTAYIADDIQYSVLPTVNQWTLVTINRVGNTAKIYYNGSVVASATVTRNYVSGNSYLGVDIPAGGNYSNIKLSTFYYYNRGLSDTEITQNFNATKSRFGL